MCLMCLRSHEGACVLQAEGPQGNPGGLDLVPKGDKVVATEGKDWLEPGCVSLCHVALGASCPLFGLWPLSLSLHPTSSSRAAECGFGVNDPAACRGGSAELGPGVSSL